MNWDPFEALDAGQQESLRAFADMLVDMNQRINLISREDEEGVLERHITHCLFLTAQRFPSGATIVDWGTGGGLPSVVLAIACPHVHVVAVDAVDKKIRAVRAMARRLGLHHLDAVHARAETVAVRADYSVSRATAPLATLWSWHRQLLRQDPRSAAHEEDDTKDDKRAMWAPGLICMKGGELVDEIDALELGVNVERIPLSTLDDRDYFRDKAILACALEAGLRYEPDGGSSR